MQIKGGMVHNSKIKQISLAVCLALTPFTVDAAGLGKMTVLSGLGEPLIAEIEVQSATQEELSTLSARIAPPETYEEQGIERNRALGSISVELAKRSDGTPVLRLRTPQPVNEPFLDMLIQVEWSSGRLLREYTALLDPPGYGEQSSTMTAQASPVVTPAERTSQSAQEKPNAGSSARQAKKKTSSAVDAASAPQEDYKTRSGDTLHAIAQQTLVEGVSLEQMLVGLYRANPHAFSGNNMNRLKVGQILRIPDVQELQAVDPQEAHQEIRIHAADWNAYRNRLAGAVASSVAAPEAQPGQSVSGKITAPAEDKSAPPAQGPRDVVKLSKGDADPVKLPGADAKPGELQAKLNALQEEVTAREKAIQEANTRIAALEKQINDMQRLLQLKSQTLADMQRQVESTEEPTLKPETKPVQATESVPAPAATSRTEATTTPAQALTPTKPTPQQPVSRPQPAPVAETSMVGTVLQEPLLAGGAAGGLLALLGGVWLYYRNKRRKGLDSFEQGILTTGGLKPNTVFGNTAGGTVDTGDTSFLTDFSQGAVGGMIDTNDVDPIAEAEVYMAYGRDAQAEEILKDAIAREPKRYELHQKLLEIYAHRKDTSAFETLAGELYATLGSTDPHWAKVAELGRTLEPDNPLYSVDVGAGHGAEATVSSDAAAHADFDMAMPVEAESQAEPALDFSVGPEPVVELPQEGVASLDFDLGDMSLEPSAQSAVDAGKASAVDTLPDLEFELPVAESPAAETASNSGQDAGGLDFQLELPEPAAADNVQLDAADLGLPAEGIPPASEGPTVELPALELPELTPVAQDTSLQEAEESGPVLDLTLPESVEPLPGEVEEANASLPDISLDLPPVSTDAGVEIAAVAESPSTSLDLELSEKQVEDLPAETAMSAQTTVGISPEPNVEEPQSIPELNPEDMEKTMVFQAPVVETAPEDIVVDANPAADGASDGGLNFDFDLDLGEPAAESTVPATEAALPDLDLSGISLDLDASGASAGKPESVEEITLSASEPADVDTKLDLVTAYMDMGDIEGARELLEEVLKEGGPNQRARAQEMLASLG